MDGWTDRQKGIPHARMDGQRDRQRYPMLDILRKKEDKARSMGVCQYGHRRTDRWTDGPTVQLPAKMMCTTTLMVWVSDAK
jgi:hypothetical protein